MNKYFFPVVTVLIAEFAGSAAWSQADLRTRPSSQASGYASRELQRIYSQSVPSIRTPTVAREQSRSIAQATFGSSQAQYSRPSSLLDSSPGVRPRASAKPFASATTSPTVSPYLNLFLEDNTLGDTSVPVYNTLVRPQLDQQRLNQQTLQRSQDLSRQVQSVAAQAAFQPQGSEQQSPTGHPTVFQNTGRYYPGNFRRR